MNDHRLGESMTNTRKVWTQPDIKVILLNAAKNGTQTGKPDGSKGVKS